MRLKAQKPALTSLTFLISFLFSVPKPSRSFHSRFHNVAQVALCLLKKIFFTDQSRRFWCTLSWVKSKSMGYNNYLVSANIIALSPKFEISHIFSLTKAKREVFDGQNLAKLFKYLILGWNLQLDQYLCLFWLLFYWLRAWIIPNCFTKVMS